MSIDQCHQSTLDWHLYQQLIHISIDTRSTFDRHLDRFSVNTQSTPQLTVSQESTNYRRHQQVLIDSHELVNTWPTNDPLSIRCWLSCQSSVGLVLIGCRSSVNQHLTTDAFSTHDPPNQPISLLSINQDLCFPVKKTGWKP